MHKYNQAIEREGCVKKERWCKERKREDGTRTNESDEGKLVTCKIWWIILPFESQRLNGWNFILKAIYHFWHDSSEALAQSNPSKKKQQGGKKCGKHSKWSNIFQCAFLLDYHWRSVLMYLLTINNNKSDRKISNRKNVDSTSMKHENNHDDDNNTAYRFIIKFIDWHFRMSGKHDWISIKSASEPHSYHFA